MLPEHASNGDAIGANDAAVTRKACRQLGDLSEASTMVVAPGEQCGPRWRTQCGGMKLGVTKPRPCDAIERWRGNNAAERAGSTEANIIGHDEEDIRCTGRRNHSRRPVGLRITRIVSDDAAKRHGRRRELTAVDCGGCVGRTGLTVGVQGVRLGFLRRSRRDVLPISNALARLGLILC